jgi:hypothetical protein
MAGELQVPALRTQVPRDAAPLRKVTVPPVAVAGVTLAVKVTAAPTSEGFTDEVTAVVEEALLTVRVIAAEVLAR